MQTVKHSKKQLGQKSSQEEHSSPEYPQNPTQTYLPSDAGLKGYPQSQFLIAAIEPSAFILQFGNEAFCNLLGLTGDLPSQNLSLTQLFVDFTSEDQEKLYRRHLLPLVLRDIYHLVPYSEHYLEEPILLSHQSPEDLEPRYLQFWLRSQQVTVQRIDPNLDEFAEFDLLSNTLNLSHLEKQLHPENYHLEGQFIWEGLDVTQQEQLQSLINLLITPGSLFGLEKFPVINQKLRSLFRADDCLIFSVKHNDIYLFTQDSQQTIQTTIYSLKSLTGSIFLKAAKENEVLAINHLEVLGKTELEQQLIQAGVKSCLVLPLVLISQNYVGVREKENHTQTTENSSGQLMGIVALNSHHPQQFDSLDRRHGKQLIPGFSAALRQCAQTQFSHIHPSVEWRFLEEAERRSWGIEKQPIIFKKVYPMYGISDIRGSSKERNLAIQKDLMTQFCLGLAIIDAVKEYQPIAFLQQLHLDLLAYIERIEKEIKVDDEITAIQYLQDYVESNFDYFRQCGGKAVKAIEAYEKACNPEHQCVYTARANYDKTVHIINSLLRQTWEQWQQKMQQIIPHYCDVEFTDGIDHMLYVGEAINPNFSHFHLSCLRYEQLRAVCDCARTCFDLYKRYNTTLELAHLVLVQDTTVDIFHDEQTERLFDVCGTRDTRYEIVKKRIDKGVNAQTGNRITQPDMLTIVYSTDQEWEEYRHYLRYLTREGWVSSEIEVGTVEPLPGVTGLKFARVKVLPPSSD